MGKIRYESSVHRLMMLIICVESVQSVVNYAFSISNVIFFVKGSLRSCFLVNMLHTQITESLPSRSPRFRFVAVVSQMKLFTD